MLTVSELFANVDFYAHHPQIKEFASTSGYSNAAIITIFLSEQKAINTFNGDFSKLVPAIQALAQQTAESTIYSWQFHILALASVIERPIYAVYPDIQSAWAVKLACRGYFYPRKVLQSGSNLGTLKNDAIFCHVDENRQNAPFGLGPQSLCLAARGQKNSFKRELCLSSC